MNVLPLFVLYVILNVISFVMYAWDKRKAKMDKRRVKESMLLVAALIAPWGAVASMRLVKHKTQKLKFKLVYVFLALHVVLLVYPVCSNVLAI